jgi:GT2 family glycosyltransferase
MALAEERAMVGAPDYLLWLNDDVVLDRRALATLLAAEDQSGGDRIVVGSVVDPETGTPTYGGADRFDWHPMRYRLVAPLDGAPQPCTTFNGNVVLVPRSVYQKVGGIERRFAHACADYDYGLRARALGFEVVVAGHAVGTCTRGPRAPWNEPSLSLISRYRLMLGRKGIPVGSSAFYLRRHGGRAWPLYLVATYAKVTSRHVRSRMLAVRGP